MSAERARTIGTATSASTVQDGRLASSVAAMRLASWIWADNLRTFMESLARICDGSFDDDDWTAVETGVRDTDGERGAWYSWPVGEPAAWTARIARDPGTAVVLIEVEAAAATIEQRAKVDLLLELCSTYVLARR